MDNISLAPQWRSFASGPAESPPKSLPRGPSLAIHPTNNDTWSSGTRANARGLGRDFALNLAPAPTGQPENPGWGSHSSRKKDQRQWNSGRGMGGSSSGRQQYGGDRDRSRPLTRTEPFKSSKASARKPSRPEPKLSASILGAALKPERVPEGPKSGEPPQTWAVGTVRRKREPKHEEPPEDRLKESKARDCSERQLFRKVFNGLHQYRVSEIDKETLAQQTFNASLFRKVFDRLRSPGDDDQEIAFLRQLGWAPEGESEELDGSPLTEEEIAAFQTVHDRRAASELGNAGHVDDGSSSCTSDSEDDEGDVPIFF